MAEPIFMNPCCEDIKGEYADGLCKTSWDIKSEQIAQMLFSGMPLSRAFVVIIMNMEARRPTMMNPAKECAPCPWPVSK